MINHWLRLNLAAWSLGMDALSVVALRSLRLGAGGPSAEREARRMIAEKVKATAQLHALALTGGLGRSPHRASAKTLTHYRKVVRANRRRLLK